MSRLYDTVEPAVIDDDMLMKAVEDQGPKEEAGKIAKEEGINFHDVTALRLDFKNILKIDNLWTFTNIVKLQLDNNIVEKIEGLETLTCLVWLDLSFNNIEVIEGLHTLTNLEDLTLYNNRIQKIENMDALTKLHIFSIGNNSIKELDNVSYLRRFKQLQTLNLTGNPISEQADCKLYVIAHLPYLEYLDYRLIDETSKQAAFTKYDIAIQEMQHDEKIAARKAEEAAKLKAEEELNRLAFVESLNGPQLFESMYADDVEGQKLSKMPGVPEMLQIYRDRFMVICVQLFEYALGKHEERIVEVDTFYDSINEAKEDNREMGIAKINNFIEYKAELWNLLNTTTDSKLQEEKVSEYNEKASELWDALMGIEMQLVDQLEESIKDFERNLSDMVAAFIEYVQGQFTQCRDYETQHHEKLLELAIMNLEKAVKNELEEELPEDLRDLFVDKDTLINAVSSSHDVHLLKIDNREDTIITQVNSWMKNLLNKIHDEEEVERNRNRVTEICNLVDHLREEVDTLDWPNY
ncbi:Dynein regulatory complex subunit 3 [Lamellibrachia satsuma]|nr:Dynein regulatory complex subunit 3 [Lamellibrachia satsuma]